MRAVFINNFQFTWAAVAIGGATLIAGGVKAANAKKQAKKLQANRPQFEASPYLQDQINLAESELSNGVSARSEQMYNNSTDRSVSSQLNAILKSGGSINNVSDLFDASDVGRQRFAMMQDNLRLQNINNLSRAQSGSETQRQQQFQFNSWAPWADASKANAEARQGAAQMMNSGINTAGGALIGYAGQQGWGSGGGGGNGNSINNISGTAPSQSGYIPQQQGYNGSVGAAFPQAPLNAPSLPMNYNNTYGYVPYQNRPQ